jgi:DNA-binding transcriptional LysR family regulator
MNLNETAAFVAVARYQSFTAAEAATGVPKSTLSRQVKRLEERLGVQLLWRTTRELSLTEAGRAYFEQCEAPVDRIEQAEQALEELSARPRGTLRIATPPLPERLAVAMEFDRFVERYPDVNLDIHEGQRPVDIVADGFDVALRGGNLDDSDLVGRVLMRSLLFFAAAPSYLEAAGTPQTLDELDQHDVLMFRPGPQLMSFPLQTPDGVVHWRPQPRVSVNSFGVLRDLAVAGRGVAFCELGQTLDELETGALVRVLPEVDSGTTSGGFWVVRPAGRVVPPKVRVFIDHIVDACERNFQPRMQRLLQGA